MADFEPQLILDTIRQRRSVRDFDDRLVPSDVVRDIIQAAGYAPTSCNMQLYHFVIVDSPELLAKLAKPITGKINWCRQMAVLLVDPSITFENQANYISAGMVVQNFLLRATELGVATCPIAGFKNKHILHEMLNIPERYDIPLLIFFGYPSSKDHDGHIPYRLPAKQMFSYNAFDGPIPFPTSSSIDAWTQDQIYDYRRRIFSVYFTRFGHSMWGETYAAAIWPFIAPHVGTARRILYLFPWEKSLLERLSVVQPEGTVDIADDNPELMAFTQKHFSYVIDRALRLDSVPPEGCYDTVIIAGSLEFNKDVDMLLNFSSAALKEGGSLLVTTSRPMGFLGLTLKILEITGRQRDIYHNSLFYKLGPRRFRGKAEMEHLASTAGLKMTESRNCDTAFLSRRVRGGAKAAIVRLASRLLPETGVYRFIRR